MESVRRAVIDIGTNSVKLLVADVRQDGIVPVWEDSKQTRLGRGFYQNRQLQPEAISATTKAVWEYARAAQERGVGVPRIIATSAVRDAKNASELTDAIKAATRLEVEIFSGDQEADFVFRGVAGDSRFANTTLLLMDVGGGSTEFVLGRNPRKEFSASFPLGSVRLLEQFPTADPPKSEELSARRNWIEDFLQKEVSPQLQPMLDKILQSGDSAPRLVGTGGTATILGRMEAKMDRYDREGIEAANLTAERVQWHVNYLWSLPIEARKRIIGLPASRADVILMGALIYESVMRVYNFGELQFSTRGLRFAAVAS